jgi:hypothetical protein
MASTRSTGRHECDGQLWLRLAWSAPNDPRRGVLHRPWTARTAAPTCCIRRLPGIVAQRPMEPRQGRRRKG